MDPTLQRAKALARSARQDEPETQDSTGSEMPVLDLDQLAVLAGVIYATFARGTGPAWETLSVETRGAFMLQVQDRVLPVCKPFETKVSSLTLTMLSKRAVYLATLATPRPVDPAALIPWRDRLDEAQYAMHDAVSDLERCVDEFHKRRAAARMQTG